MPGTVYVSQSFERVGSRSLRIRTTIQNVRRYEHFDPGKEYLIATIAIENGRGTPPPYTCNGCAAPARIVLQKISFRSTQSAEFAFDLDYPSVTNEVAWHGGIEATPTVNRTWGMIKSLYH